METQASVIRQEKRNKGIQIGKTEMKLFTCRWQENIENPNESTKKKKKSFVRASGYQTNTHKNQSHFCVLAMYN
jgi:hypothetical protein